MNYMFEINELAILNEHVVKGLPDRVGELVKIYNFHAFSPNYDYVIELDNGDLNPVKESELNKLTDKQKELSKYIFKGNHATHYPTSEEVAIRKVDYLFSHAEIDFLSGGSTVVDFWTLRKIEKEVDSVEETKNTAHDDLLDLFFEHYNNHDDTYTLPKELLVNMLKGLYVEGE